MTTLAVMSLKRSATAFARALRGAAIALTATLGVASAEPVASRVEMHTLQHDGGARAYGLYVPANLDPAAQAPILIALHGRFSSAAAFHAQSGLAAIAEQRGAIVAYPEPVNISWNDGGSVRLGRRDPPADDAGFIAAMVSDIARTHPLDLRNRYLVGDDIGGAFAYALACRQDAAYAGVAIVGALMWDFIADECAVSHPAPLLIIHGRRDELFTVNGGGVGAATARRAARRLGVRDTLVFWRERNGCGASPMTLGESVFYRACAASADIAYVGVRRGGHMWFRSGDRYRLNQYDVDAARLIDSFFFARADFALPQDRTLNTGARSYLTYVPPNYDPAVPTPLVIALHGRPGTGSEMAAIAELNPVAARHGFVVVYPDGANNEWNAVGDLAGVRDAGLQDDVQFLKDLASDIGADLNIDRTRMYITGFSNGGFMTLRMSCSAPDTFAAFAAVGASLYTYMREICQRAPPTPVMMIHGNADSSVPFGGGVARDSEGGTRRVTLTAPETLQFFARRNGCGENVERSEFAQRGASPNTSVVRFAATACPNNANVNLYAIIGGGHVWPGVQGVMDESVFGPVNMDINAGEEIWAFFERHRLSPP